MADLDMRSVRSKKSAAAPAEPLAVVTYDRATLRSFKAIFTGPPAGLKSTDFLRTSTHGRDSPTSGFDLLSRDLMMRSEKMVIGENAWQPGKLSSTEDEEFDRAIIGMLNKLTPAKYADVIKSFDLTRIYADEKKTSIAVKHIFGKALQEPSYSQLYVQVCKDILHCPDNKEQGMDFRKQILSFAQNEFEETMKSLDGSSASKEETNTAKFKKRQTTNIKFIGELYLASVLNIRVIHAVTTTLLEGGANGDDAPDDTRIEMLCMLLQIVGSRLEETDRALLDQTMSEITELLEVGYQPRIVFLLMGILETRKLRWVPRVAKAGETNVTFKAPQVVVPEATRNPRGSPAWGSSEHLPRVTSDPRLSRDAPRRPSPRTPVNAAAKRPPSSPAAPPKTAAPSVPNVKKSDDKPVVASQSAMRLTGDEKTDAQRMVVAEVMASNDIRSAMLTNIWDFCLSGKKEESLHGFLTDAAWGPEVGPDLIEALGVCIALAVIEDAFSDSPKFQQRWLSTVLVVFPGGFAQTCQILSRAVQYFLTVNVSEDDDDDADPSALIDTICSTWDSVLTELEKDPKADVTRAILDGVFGFLQVPGCPGAIIDSVGGRAAKCPLIQKIKMTVWFKDQTVSGATTVQRMTSYFGIK